MTSGELTVNECAHVDLLSIHALEACGPDTFTSVKIMSKKEADRRFNIYRYPDGKLGSFLPKFCRRGVKVMVDDIPEETAAEWAWRMMLEVSSSVGMQADEVVFEGALD